MKVLLINPPFQDSFYNREFYLPSSLLYLAGSLQEKGHNPKILDLKTFHQQRPNKNFYESKILKTISEFEPNLIGFGCLFSGDFPSVLNYSNLTKQHHPKIPNVIGGITQHYMLKKF